MPSIFDESQFSDECAKIIAMLRGDGNAAEQHKGRFQTCFEHPELEWKNYFLETRKIQ